MTKHKVTIVVEFICSKDYIPQEDMHAAIRTELEGVWYWQPTTDADVVSVTINGEDY